MARHADSGQRERGHGPLLVFITVCGLLIVSVIVAATSMGDPRTLLARAPFIGDNCPSTRLPTTQLNVVVSPDMMPTLQQALGPMATEKLSDGRCLHISLQAQAPAETIEGAQILPQDRAPNVWIPDSSLWISRVPEWKMHPVAAFASTPVVLATSHASLQALGWDKKPPSWAEALGGRRPVADPDLANDAPGLASAIAMFAQLGGITTNPQQGQQAQLALVGAVLATARNALPSQEAALQVIENNSATAPLVPTTEQQVILDNRGLPGTPVVPLFPTGGSPTLDYPVLQVDSSSPSEHQRVAIQAVVAQLKSARTATLVQQAGLRDPNGVSAAPGATPVTKFASVPAPIIATLVDRITVLLAPSRILVVMDVSKSMALTSGYLTNDRIGFAAIAAKTGGDLLPDRASAGLWVFSRDMDGTTGKNYEQMLPIQPLGTPMPGGTDDRAVFNQKMFGLNSHLGGDGTALYTTTIAAMKYMEANYDPRAGNAVVLYTDGADNNPGGPTLAQTLAQLHTIFKPNQPVRLVAIGMGDADMNALSQMAAAAGGKAFKASNPADIPAVVFSVMNERKGT